MAAQNNISAALSADDITAIEAAIATIRTKLPFIVALTKEQRQRLPRSNGGRQAFLERSLIFAEQNPDAFPATFNKVEYFKDRDLSLALAPVVAAIAQLNGDARDTELALKSDLFVQSLDVYAVAKFNNRNGAYDEYIDSVRDIFPRGPRTQPPPTP